jgi:hypothetical protein
MSREDYEEEERRIIAERPRDLSTEGKLINKGFGAESRLVGGRHIQHLCANCCYLADKMGKDPHVTASKHSMQFCLKEGGGMFGQSLHVAMDGQQDFNDDLMKSADSNSSNARARFSNRLMTTEGASGRARGTSDGGVLLRPSRLKMVFRSVSTMASVPGDGATPQEGQYLQEDSGADMTMVDSKEWCALGYTTSVRLYAGTAKVSDDAKRIDAVAPLVLVMDGELTDGEPTRTIRFFGPAAVSFTGEWARLLSPNGMLRYGFDEAGDELLLDNNVNAKDGYIVFDESDPSKRVQVPMVRHGGGSFVKARPPTTDELNIFLRHNPHLTEWTADALMRGTIKAQKVTLRGHTGTRRPTAPREPRDG